jgi:hypothetical protein
VKTKTIKLLLGKKLKEWTSTIADEALRKEVKEHAIVTGGSIVSMLLNEEVNDYDIYFDSQDLALRVAKYYVDKFMEKPPKAFLNAEGKIGKTIQIVAVDGGVKLHIKSAGIVGENSDKYSYYEYTPEENAENYVEAATTVEEGVDRADEASVPVEKGDPKKPCDYRPVFFSQNAITLAGRIQLIFRFAGSPEEIHKNYDFVHCTGYHYQKELVLTAKTLECILAKELVYQGSLYPICSLFRIRKFLKRGWTITAGQILKIALQVSKLDLSNHAVLQEQLIGVDAAYFQELLTKLNEHDPNQVDTAYLVKILDAIS